MIKEQIKKTQGYYKPFGSREQIEKTFTYHPPFGDQPDRYARIRNAANDIANLILELTPESGEQTLAFRYLQQAVMFANSAIAINEERPE